MCSVNVSLHYSRAFVVNMLQDNHFLFYQMTWISAEARAAGGYKEQQENKGSKFIFLLSFQLISPKNFTFFPSTYVTNLISTYASSIVLTPLSNLQSLFSIIDSISLTLRYYHMWKEKNVAIKLRTLYHSHIFTIYHSWAYMKRKIWANKLDKLFLKLHL